MKEYDKLVRDKIPDIIQKTGKNFEITKANTDEMKLYLEKKLYEEISEYIESNNLEELADIMEVIYGLSNSLGYSEQDLNVCREKKHKERGGFKEGIILKKVWDK